MKISRPSISKSVRGETLECRCLLAADFVSSQLTDFSSFRSNAEIDFRDVREGDFDGDGRMDIVGRHAGDWWVGRTGGDDDSEFLAERWATWSDVDWIDVWAADFNGDGFDDLVGRTGGDWWVAVSTGRRFLNQHWGRWSDSVDWQDVCVGDFNNDGMADITGRTGGGWWVARSTGETFLNEYWGEWSLDVDWREVHADDFNNDGLDDIAGLSDGAWWVGISNGQSFETSYDPHFEAGQVSASSIVNADLNNDGTVGFDDFIILSANYQNEVTAGSDGDLDGSGIVDFQDFLLLSEQYVV